jgi:hypothetical protein
LTEEGDEQKEQEATRKIDEDGGSIKQSYLLLLGALPIKPDEALGRAQTHKYPDQLDRCQAEVQEAIIFYREIASIQR